MLPLALPKWVRLVPPASIDMVNGFPEVESVESTLVPGRWYSGGVTLEMGDGGVTWIPLARCLAV